MHLFLKILIPLNLFLATLSIADIFFGVKDNTCAYLPVQNYSILITLSNWLIINGSVTNGMFLFYLILPK
jgi:hypothetical protein